MIKEPSRARAGGCVAVQIGAGDGLSLSPPLAPKQFDDYRSMPDLGF